jgi:hypothetical protein|tara:strand:+ start:933 stop:1439 length:507 start_codon:yes stop_codon:yes gene_type:complete
MSVVAALGLGLQFTQMIGGARRGAKQSRSNIASDRKSLGLVNQALGELETLGTMKEEVAQSDFTEGLTMKGKQLGRDKTQLVKQVGEMNDQFAFSGEGEQKLTDAVESIDVNFEDTKKMEEKRLDESLSAITEWKGGEKARLDSEKHTLLSSIDANQNTDTFWENIFG